MLKTAEFRKLKQLKSSSLNVLKNSKHANSQIVGYLALFLDFTKSLCPFFLFKLAQTITECYLLINLLYHIILTTLLNYNKLPLCRKHNILDITGVGESFVSGSKVNCISIRWTLRW